MASVPSSMAEDFAGLRGVPLRYFGAVLVLQEGDWLERVGVVTDEAVYVTFRNGEVESWVPFDAIVEMLLDSTRELVSLSTPSHPLMVLHPQNYAVFVDAVDTPRKTFSHPTRPRAPKPYFPSDRACTECDDGGAEYAVAKYICYDCDGKFCDPCWHARHTGLREHHEMRPLLYPCEMCGRSGGLPALWWCGTCQCRLCERCWAEQHESARHAPEQLYPTVESTPPPREARDPPREVEDTVGGKQAALQEVEEELAEEATAPVSGEFRMYRDAYIPKGGDVLTSAHLLTIDEALAVARAHPKCRGFTFRGPPPASPFAKVRVYFKNKTTRRRGNWTSWCRVEAPTAPPKPTSPPPPARTPPTPPEKPADTPQTPPLPTPPAAPPAPPAPPAPARATWLPPSFSTPPVAHGVAHTAKAVVVAVSYHGTEQKLPSTLKAANVMRHFLQRSGFQSELRVLVDNNPTALPTRRNIMAALRWLADDALPGDSLFLYLAGHGGEGGLAPVDHDTAGPISPDDLRSALLDDIPAGCRLTMLCDLCCGGGPVRFPHVLETGSAPSSLRGKVEVLMDPVRLVASREIGGVTYGARAVMLSASPSDLEDDGMLGMATIAFIGSLSRNPAASYTDLLTDGARLLQQSYPAAQRLPMLRISSAHPFSPSEPFSFHPITGQSKEEEDLEWLFRTADHNNDGVLDFREMQWLAEAAGRDLTRTAYEVLCRAIRAPISGLSLRHLRQAYQDLDAGAGVSEDRVAVEKALLAHSTEWPEGSIEADLMAREEGAPRILGGTALKSPSPVSTPVKEGEGPAAEQDGKGESGVKGVPTRGAEEAPRSVLEQSPSPDKQSSAPEEAPRSALEPSPSPNKQSSAPIQPQEPQGEVVSCEGSLDGVESGGPSTLYDEDSRRDASSRSPGGRTRSTVDLPPPRKKRAARGDGLFDGVDELSGGIPELADELGGPFDAWGSGSTPRRERKELPPARKKGHSREDEEEKNSADDGEGVEEATLPVDAEGAKALPSSSPSALSSSVPSSGSPRPAGGEEDKGGNDGRAGGAAESAGSSPKAAHGSPASKRNTAIEAPCDKSVELSSL